MTKELDLYDFKILNELDKNSRESASKIAKKVRLSKVSVNQRIRKLQEKGIIKAFITQVDYRKLGYNNCRVFYKLQNLSSEDEEKFYSYLISHKLIAYIGRMDGNFDTFLAVFYKSNEQMDEMLHEINAKFGKNIKERIILPIINAQYFGRRYLIKAKELKYVKPIIRQKPEKLIELDELDHKILQELDQNARIPAIELAGKLGVTKDVAHYRLKKLIGKGIIQKFALDIKQEKIGQSFFKILINIGSDADELEFLRQIVSFDNLVKAMRLLGSWSIELDFEVENNLKMRAILKQMKEKLGKDIQAIDSLFVYHVDKLSYYPF